MVFIVPDPSGLAEGITSVGQAFGSVLAQRGQEKRQQAMKEALMEKEYGYKSALAMQKTALQQALENQRSQEAAALFGGDFQGGSSPLGMQVQQPSPAPGIFDPIVQDPSDPGVQPTLLQTNEDVMYSQITNLPSNYAKNDPMRNHSDQQLVQLSNNPNPQISKRARTALEFRQKTRDSIQKDRRQGFQENKVYMDGIEKERDSVKNLQQNISQIEWALNNKDLSSFSTDWWIQNLRKWKIDLVSPEGNILESNIKDFLIQDVGQIKGRPNQFIEQRILDSLPKMGKSRAANIGIMSSFRIRNKRNIAKIELTDRLIKEDLEKYGSVQPNLSGRMDEQLKSVNDQLDREQSYELRRAQEMDQGMDRLLNKKPPFGTPLTLNMLSTLTKKYGGDSEKALKHAKKLGYQIFDKDEIRRLHNESSFRK